MSDLEAGNCWCDRPDQHTPWIEVRKLAALIPVSCCVMTDTTGVNHCEHPPPPQPPLHRRLRWRLRSSWEALRLRAGSWVAGVNLEDDE